ncbi:cardioacceleratory peptide receptor-like isoform X2 [Brevipalpus obovatus]|uniref:cardioacceleratory peptide receptor-like isoform X2 n=1 Tax=Brevipalpus obovatus TaxID=246614 RepID=UPI003D9E1193
MTTTEIPSVLSEEDSPLSIYYFWKCCVTYGSTYVLVSLSIDRYDAITHPLNFTSRARRAKFLITAAWSLSALLSVPQLVLSRIELKSGYPQCGIELASAQHWQIYVTLIFVSVFLIPAIIISACYSLIVHTIWKESRLMGSSRKRLRQLNGSVDGNRNGKNTDGKLTGFESAEIDFKRVSSRGVIPRAKIKTVKMTLVIVFAFIICWTPYFLWDLLQVFQFIPDTETTRPITTFIQSMAPLNSAANPLIYCLFSAHCRNIRRYRLYTWLVDKLCFCIPSNRIVRNSELTTTLTSTFTRSPGQTSVSLQTRSMPINFRNSSFLQVSKSDNFEFSSETDSPIHDMAKYRPYGNSQL